MTLISVRTKRIEIDDMGTGTIVTVVDIWTKIAVFVHIKSPLSPARESQSILNCSREHRIALFKISHRPRWNFRCFSVFMDTGYGDSRSDTLAGNHLMFYSKRHLSACVCVCFGGEERSQPYGKTYVVVRCRRRNS